ncbi:hypothetical protein R1sor_003369 [Riccia sorocarpa]|uniref:Uncharacterized protein n=1 Tax=Riccia sorocarpa TaxID=122646 RepID=A0ABD3H446_9MARC
MWFLDGLPEGMEMYCRRMGSNTLDEAFKSAETYEVVGLHRRNRKSSSTSSEDSDSKQRRKKGKKKKKKSKKYDSSSSSSSSSSSPSSSSSSSSEEDTKKAKKKKKARRKLKDRKSTPRRSEISNHAANRPVSPGKEDMKKKMDEITKSLGDLKVQVIGAREPGRRPTMMRQNLWCSTYGRTGHSNTECYATRPAMAIQQVEWDPYWHSYQDPYYDHPEEVSYAVQDIPPSTLTTSAAIPRYKPTEYVRSPQQRRMPGPPFQQQKPPSNRMSKKDDKKSNKRKAKEKKYEEKKKWKNTSSKAPRKTGEPMKEKEKDKEETPPIAEPVDTPPPSFPADIRKEVEGFLQEEIVKEAQKQVLHEEAEPLKTKPSEVKIRRSECEQRANEANEEKKVALEYAKHKDVEKASLEDRVKELEGKIETIEKEKASLIEEGKKKDKKIKNLQEVPAKEKKKISFNQLAEQVKGDYENVLKEHRGDFERFRASLLSETEAPTTSGGKSSS